MTEQRYEELRSYRNQLRDKFESVKATGFLKSGRIKNEIKEIDKKLSEYETNKNKKI